MFLLLQEVVQLIKTHFEVKQGLPTESPLTIPLYPVPSHEEPRFSCFAEAEAGGVSLTPTRKTGEILVLPIFIIRRSGFRGCSLLTISCWY